MIDTYVYIIVALLPLTALMVVIQDNPYQALILRGVLGAVAVLVYTVLGAPDVGLTEAMVGTLLAITLYAVAVRSSLVMRLGVFEKELSDQAQNSHFEELMEGLRQICKKRHMRLELIPYMDVEALNQGLMDGEIHAICTQQSLLELQINSPEEENQIYHMAIRVQRLYDIIKTELSSPLTSLSYVNELDFISSNQKEIHI